MVYLAVIKRLTFKLQNN